MLTRENDVDNDLVEECPPEALIDLIDKTGLAYIHSSGCAVLQNGAWLQPEQWDVWLQHLNEGEKEEC